MELAENRWKTFGELIGSNVREYPHRTFLKFMRQGQLATVTYARFGFQTLKLHEQLKSHGLARGARIVFYLEDILPSTYLGLTCAQFGYVHVMAGSVLSIETLKELMARCQSEHVFTTQEHARALVNAGIRPLVIYEDGDQPDGDTLPLRLAETEPDVDVLLAELERETAQSTEQTVVRLGLTSGSTGKPKIVSRSHKTAMGRNILRTFDLQRGAAPPDRVLLAAGITHGLGYSQILAAMYLAGELCITTKSQTASELAEIRVLDPTVIHVPPRYYKSWYEQQARLDGPDRSHRLFGPSLKIAGTGGAAPDYDMMKRIHAQGVDIVESYGSNETDMIAIAKRGEYKFDGWIGRPPPDVMVKLAEDGELLIKSATLFPGYLDDEQSTQNAFTEDGWYRTGEFAALSEDGKVGIRGRKKDVFNTPDGSNIYPERLERILEANEIVRQVILVGDQRPFIIGLFSMKQPASTGEGPYGVLARARAPQQYRDVEQLVDKLNETVETFERVRAIVLFAGPFPADIYKAANLGKTSRDRKKTVAMYGPLIEEIYRTETR